MSFNVPRNILCHVSYHNRPMWYWPMWHMWRYHRGNSTLILAVCATVCGIKARTHDVKVLLTIFHSAGVELHFSFIFSELHGRSTYCGIVKTPIMDSCYTVLAEKNTRIPLSIIPMGIVCQMDLFQSKIRLTLQVGGWWQYMRCLLWKTCLRTLQLLSKFGLLPWKFHAAVSHPSGWFPAP